MKIIVLFAKCHAQSSTAHDTQTPTGTVVGIRIRAITLMTVLEQRNVMSALAHSSVLLQCKPHITSMLTDKQVTSRKQCGTEPRFC